MGGDGGDSDGDAFLLLRGVIFDCLVGMDIGIAIDGEVKKKEYDLLKEAEREIFKDKLKNENTRTVNANDLLQDVEADLEQSFRAKVFETLKSSYDSVKTAVANRNN